MLYTFPASLSSFLDVYESFSVPLITFVLRCFSFSSTLLVHVSVPVILFICSCSSNYSRLNYFIDVFFFDDVGLNSSCMQFDALIILDTLGEMFN